MIIGMSSGGIRPIHPFAMPFKKPFPLIRGLIIGEWMRARALARLQLSLTLVASVKITMQVFGRVGNLYLEFPLSLFILNTVCSDCIVWPINVRSRHDIAANGIVHMCLAQNLSYVTSAQHELTIIKFPILSVVLILKHAASLSVSIFTRKKNTHTFDIEGVRGEKFKQQHIVYIFHIAFSRVHHFTIRF